MTTVIGIRSSDFAVLASDSRLTTVTDDGTIVGMQTTSASHPKIAAIGNYLIGTAGDVRAINILSYAFHPPQPPTNLTGKKLDEFFTTRFIPSLRECFDAHGYSTPIRDSSNHMAEQSSDMLVAINQHIYQVDNDYAWTVDTSGVFAIGTGCQYALGALSILCAEPPTTTNQARNVALKALAVAAKFDPHTGFPYQVFNQTGNAKKPKVTRGRTKSDG